MNLVSAFPEVDLFFSSTSFNDNELLSFLSEIDSNYTDRNERKSVHGLIALKMLQYESFPKNTTSFKKSITKSKLIKKKSVVHYKFHPLISYLKHFSVESVANSLDMRTERFISFLKQKNIEKQNSDLFSNEEFLIVQEMLSSFLYALERKEKSSAEIKKVRYANNQKSMQKNTDVYSKIVAYGGTGKLIYIRKK